MISRRIISLLVGAGLVGSGQAAAQQTGQPLAVGTEAPDFELVGSTRYGVLQEPIRLSAFRGETVVLAFFFKARTPG